MKFVGEDARGQRKVFESWREIAEQAPYDRLDFESFSKEQIDQLLKEYRSAVEHREHGDGIDLVTMQDQPLDPNEDPIKFFAARQIRFIEHSRSDRTDYFANAKQMAEDVLDRLYAPFEGLERTLIGARKQDDAREFSSADHGWVRIPPPSRPGFIQNAPNSLTGIRKSEFIRSDSLIGRWYQGEIEAYTATWYAITVLENAHRLDDAGSEDTVQLLVEIGMAAEALRRKANDNATRAGLRIFAASKKLGDISPETEQIHALLDEHIPNYAFNTEAYRKIVRMLSDQGITATVASVKKADQRRKSHKRDR